MLCYSMLCSSVAYTCRVYVRVCLHACMRVCLNMSMDVCVQACRRAGVQACRCVQVPIRVCVQVHMLCVHVCMCWYVCMCVRVWETLTGLPWAASACSEPFGGDWACSGTVQLCLARLSSALFSCLQLQVRS